MSSQHQHSGDGTITVSVGSGYSKKDFRCPLKAILCCPYLKRLWDTREANSEKISIPDGDPKSWERFYRFISPDVVGTLKHDHTDMINYANALMISWWFDKFQMKKHLDVCDKLLTQLWKKEWESLLSHDPRFWRNEKSDYENIEHHQARITKRKNLFARLLSIYGSSVKNNLIGTSHFVGKILVYLLEKRLLETSDLFDLRVIKSLLNGIPRFELDQSKKKMKRNSVDPVWSFFEKMLSPDIGTVLTEDILGNSAALLAFVYKSLEQKKSELAAKHIINTMLIKGPGKMYNALPNGRQMGRDYGGDEEKINEFGKRKYKEARKAEFEGTCKNEYKRLRLGLPQDYY